MLNFAFRPAYEISAPLHARVPGSVPHNLQRTQDGYKHVGSQVENPFEALPELLMGYGGHAAQPQVFRIARRFEKFSF